MRTFLAAIALVLSSLPAYADDAAIGSDPAGLVAVARAGVVETFDRNLRQVTTAAGVREPSLVRVSGDNVVVLDAVNGETLILRSGRETRHQGATPVDAVWAGDTVFVLDRDAKLLWRHGADGSSSRAVAQSASSLRADQRYVRVYSPMAGTIEELTHDLTEVRTLAAPRFGSDFEVSRRMAYVAVPTVGEITAIPLEGSGKPLTWRTGAVPVDIAITTAASVVRADELAIADPSSKVVWRENGPESVAAAFGRGFLRGFFGLRTSGRDVTVGRAVDRIGSSANVTVVYDTARGELFRCAGRETALIASGVAPREWTIAGESVLILDRGRLRRITW